MDKAKFFGFELLQSKTIKIFYRGTEPVNTTIAIKLRGLDVVVSSVQHIFHQQGSWFIPFIDYTGCKSVVIYDNEKESTIIEWLLPIEFTSKVKKQNLICLGLNKTGTTSFQDDTSQFLGYTYASTFDGMTKVLFDIYHNDYTTLQSLLENPRYNAYKDFPFSLPKVYEKIYEMRPNDIYVLTVRENIDLWVKSMIKYFNWILEGNVKNSDKVLNIKRGPYYDTYSNFSAALFHYWGIDSLDNIEGKLKMLYKSHNENIIDFFKSKKSENFMVVDVSKPNEFAKLCEWLGKPTNVENFSKKNVS
jgi:hypothetical protein